MFTRPKDKIILSFSGSPTVALARLLLESTPGVQCSETLLRSSPPRPFASVRFDPLAWSSGSDQRRISGCGIRWLLAGPDSRPLWLCRVCAFVLLRCFSCSHTVLPKEHSLGVIFSPHFPHVNAVFFFNSTCISLLIILVYKQQIQIKLGWALFVTYTIIQSIMRSEMCSLHLTHPSVHTWSSGQPTVQRPGSSRGLPVGAGIRTHNLGLSRVSSPTLYPLGQRPLNVWLCMWRIIKNLEPTLNLDHLSLM